MNELSIDPKEEIGRAIHFLKSTFEEQKVPNAILGLSGGIDSALSLYLLKETLPVENIFVTHMYYFEYDKRKIELLMDNCGIPMANRFIVPIKPMVDTIAVSLGIDPNINRLRIGNVMARVRMITLFDLAKKNNALVCGTENKSEHLLGYFTRFGDAASDIEPIVHLYKTQVRQIAKYLEIPEEIITQAPTAGLWSGQTDENEFGFSYDEADETLHAYYDLHVPIEKIAEEIPNAEKVIEFAEKNAFKNKTPYILQ